MSTLYRHEKPSRILKLHFRHHRLRPSAPTTPPIRRHTQQQWLPSSPAELSLPRSAGSPPPVSRRPASRPSRASPRRTPKFWCVRSYADKIHITTTTSTEILTEGVMDRFSAVSWSALSPVPASTLVRIVVFIPLFHPHSSSQANIYMLPLFFSASRPHPHHVDFGEHRPSCQEQHALGERRDRGQVPVLPRR